jgi:hypothetical protein
MFKVRPKWHMSSRKSYFTSNLLRRIIFLVLASSQRRNEQTKLQLYASLQLLTVLFTPSLSTSSNPLSLMQPNSTRSTPCLPWFPAATNPRSSTSTSCGLRTRTREVLIDGNMYDDVGIFDLHFLSIERTGERSTVSY